VVNLLLRGGFKAESVLGHITRKVSSPLSSTPSPLLPVPLLSLILPPSLPLSLPPLYFPLLEVGPSNLARGSWGSP